MRRNTIKTMLFLGWAALAAAGCSGGSDGGNTTGPGATGTVSGSVKDDAGAGVAGAAVQLTATGKAAKSTSTGNDGSYTFSGVTTGIWQVTVTPPDGYTGGSFPTVVVTADQQVNVAAVVLTKLAPGEIPLAAAVTIYQSAFSAANVTIKAGGTVTWHNIDDLTHTATGATFDTGNLAFNATSTKTFAAPGTYNYACTIHPFMTGKVTVVQ